MQNDNVLEFPESRRKFIVSIQREIEIMSVALGIDAQENSGIASTIERNALKNFLKYEHALYSGIPKFNDPDYQEHWKSLYEEQYLIKLDLIFEIIEANMKLDCRNLYHSPIH